jgi:ribonuclease P/MRP protein subunit POP1
MLQDQAKLLKKRKFRQLPIAKRRKLLRSSRIEILHGRQREKAWLETHIWHAKRMKMKDIWMYRIVSLQYLPQYQARAKTTGLQAYTPTDKAFRPSYRASMHGVIVHDSSYMQTLEVRAHFDTLQEFLSMICDASAVPPYSVRYNSGIRECHTHLYEVGRYPLGLIGPATVIWQESRKSADDEETEEFRGIIIRFHPSIMPAVADAVEKCIKRIATTRETRPPVASQNEDVAILGRFVRAIYRTFCSFEITGPMATDTIKACLKPVRDTSDDKLAAWRNLSPPAAVPSGTVLTFDVYDPRLR